MEILIGSILLIIGLVGLSFGTKPPKFRTEDGRLFEITKNGGLRLCLEDEKTQKIMAEKRKEFHETFEIVNGKLTNKITGRVIELD